MNFDINEMRQWFDNVRPWVHFLLIWSLAWLSLWMIRRVLRALKTQIVNRVDAHPDARRIATLMNVFRYTSNVVIIGLAILLTLGVIGISITPLLATAGVAGIAIGFGAQSLVKDFFSGLFLLIENQVSEGDMIEAAGKSGYVERVTLRHIRMRDVDGSVHFIPNGMITTVTNRSRGYAYAVIEFNVKRQEDIERVYSLMRATGRAMQADPQLGPDILGDIEIDGVEKIEDASVTLRCRLRVKAGRQGPMRREFLSRMKAVLDHVDEMKSVA